MEGHRCAEWRRARHLQHLRVFLSHHTTPPPWMAYHHGGRANHRTWAVPLLYPGFSCFPPPPQSVRLGKEDPVLLSYV